MVAPCQMTSPLPALSLLSMTTPCVKVGGGTAYSQKQVETMLTSERGITREQGAQVSMPWEYDPEVTRLDCELPHPWGKTPTLYTAWPGLAGKPAPHSGPPTARPVATGRQWQS